MRVAAYFDNNATTRMAPEALAAMLPYLGEAYVNPSSAYADALGMATPMVDAKRALARLFGDVGLADDFVLTSGASESNSWAVAAVPMAMREPARFVTSDIEHSSLLAALAARSRRGDVVDFAACDRDGVIDPGSLRAKLDARTAFVSFMLANNETGVIQPVARLAAAVRSVAPDALVHVDATQAVGKLVLRYDRDFPHVDLISMSAHKFHGPKGIGALYIRPGLTIGSLVHGGGEKDRRGGTPDPSRAAGLAAAANLAATAVSAGTVDMACKRDHLEERLLAMIPGAMINGARVPRLSNTSSVTIPGLDAAAAVEAFALRGVCVSDGAACTSGSGKPSHVLLAMGLPYDRARSTLRFSLSALTTSDEIEHLLNMTDEILRGRSRFAS